MGDQQEHRIAVTGQATEATGLSSDETVAFSCKQVSFSLYIDVAAIPGWFLVAVALGIVIYFCWTSQAKSEVRQKLAMLWHHFLGERIRVKEVRQKLTMLWHHFPGERIREEVLLAIPSPEKNIKRTFVGVLSCETADKLKAIFRKNSCPKLVLLKWGHKLPPECRLLICCLPRNIRQMFLDDGTVFATLIKDAGSLQAMVLIIIFGEKKTPEETLFEGNIYGSVLQQGQTLYMKGRSQGALLREQTPSGVALVTVDNRPSKYQLRFMKNFVMDAFPDKE